MRRISVVTSVATLGVAMSAVAARSAVAGEIPCNPVDAGVIQIDGLLDDWQGEQGVDVGGRDPNLSFTVRCNYDAKTIFLSVDVRDDYLVRQSAPSRGTTDDHLELRLGGLTLDYAPAAPDDRLTRRARWTGRAPKGFTALDSRQSAGWALEASLPLSQLPGYSNGVPSVPASVTVFDVDSKATPKERARLSTSAGGEPGGLTFAEGKGTFDAFLKDRQLSQRDVVFDQVGRVLAARGLKGRAIVASSSRGTWLAILSDEYAYISLPVANRKDLSDIKLVDLAGDGRDAIVLRYVERGGGGTREVLAAYRLVSEGLRRTFGVEVSKQQGANRLDTRVTFAKKGKGTEILVEPLPAKGWTQATYRETPADDLVSLPLPWGDKKRLRFQFKGDDYFQVE